MTVTFMEKKKIPVSDPGVLLEKYQYLVEKIAHNFENAPQSHRNLEEVGYIGLLNAVNLYDRQIHQMDFKTYAQILITEEMHQYLLNPNRQVDRPDWLNKLNNRIDRFVREYRQDNQRYPQISDIADHLNISSLGLYEILKTRNSLKESYTAHGLEGELANLQPEIQKIRSHSYQSFKLLIEDLVALQKACHKLRKLQENIIYCLFVMDLKQTKLSSILGIPMQKIDQMKKGAFQSLGA